MSEFDFYDETNDPPLEAAPASQPYTAETPQPWELVDTGRYMPRRIRGSCVGRELG